MHAMHLQLWIFMSSDRFVFMVDSGSRWLFATL